MEYYVPEDFNSFEGYGSNSNDKEDLYVDPFDGGSKSLAADIELISLETSQVVKDLMRRYPK